MEAAESGFDPSQCGDSRVYVDRVSVETVELVLAQVGAVESALGLVAVPHWKGVNLTCFPEELSHLTLCWPRG